MRGRERRRQAQEARPEEAQDDGGARGALQDASNKGERTGAHAHARLEFCAGQFAQSGAVLLKDPKALQDRDPEAGQELHTGPGGDFTQRQTSRRGDLRADAVQRSVSAHHQPGGGLLAAQHEELPD